MKKTVLLKIVLVLCVFSSRTSHASRVLECDDSSSSSVDDIPLSRLVLQTTMTPPGKEETDFAEKVPDDMSSSSSEEIPLNLYTSRLETGATRETAPQSSSESQDSDSLDGIHLAAQQNDSHRIIELMLAGIDINLPDSKTRTALHYASMENHHKLIENLILEKASTEHQDDLGNRPLHYAAQGGHLDSVHTLTAHDASLNAQNNLGCTPLCLAALEGRSETVALLLNKGASLKFISKEGMRAVHYAVQKDTDNHTRTLEVFLEAKASLADEDDYGPSVLCVAALNGCFSHIERLLAAGATYLSDTYSDEDACKAIVAALLLRHNDKEKVRINQLRRCLRYAIEDEFPKIIQLLHAFGAKINQKLDGITPLHRAVLLNKFRLIKPLGNLGANPNIFAAEYGTPLHVACKGGYVYSVEALCQISGLDVSKCFNNRTALHYAAESGSVPIVTSLLDAGSIVDYGRTEKGGIALKKTPLHISVEKEDEEVTKVLVESIFHREFYSLASGEVLYTPICEFELKDSKGRTALRIAAENRNLSLMGLIIEASCGTVDVDTTVSNRESILHFASTRGDNEMVQLLIESKAELNGTLRGSLSTPLHCAINNRHSKVACALIKAGADHTIQDKKGRSAKDLAEGSVLLSSLMKIFNK